MIRRVTVNALIACGAVLLTLAALEVVVRLGGEIDADGQFTFMGYVLEPYAPPVEGQRHSLKRYLENQDQSFYIYDEMLGWTHPPNAVRQSGEFTINSAGLRSRREYSQRPPSDTLRIALFGDSFTAGDEVSDDETWGHQLEIKLNQAGIRTEVLNFGVSAYGMDQAFLRWRKAGRGYAPDMVIFGFQPENLNRNVNIFSMLYFTHTLPFSKPRFVLTARGGGLELVNSPPIPPEQIIDALESFGSHPLAKYEHYYQSRDVVSRWWSFSRLASYLYEALKQPEDDAHTYGFWIFSDGPASERAVLGQAIVDAFANDVKARKAEFFVLYLPNRDVLRRALDGKPQGHQFLLDHFDDAYHYITFEDQLDRSYLNYRWPTGHYRPEITSIAAQAVADEIQSCIESGTCQLPRFEDRDVIFTSASSGDSA